MLKKVLFFLVILDAFPLLGVSLTIEPSFWGGHLIIENHQEDTDSIVEAINQHALLARGWWNITIRSQAELNLCHLLNASWLQKAMTTYIFGFRIKHLNLLQCQIRLDSNAVYLPGSNMLHLTLSEELLKYSSFQKTLQKIKKNNQIIGYRGVKTQRIIDTYKDKQDVFLSSNIN